MTQAHVRPARSADAKFLADLATQLGYPTTEPEILSRLEQLQGRDQHAVLVAEQGDQVVGWIHIFGAYRLESGAFAEIGGLVVDRAFRASGAGRALVQAAAEWARGQGFQHLRVRTNVIREDAHAFYLHLGFSNAKWQAVLSRPSGLA